MNPIHLTLSFGVAALLAATAPSQTCRRVCDINPTGSSRPGGMTACFGNTLVFGADDGTHGLEPWAYDLRTGKCTLIKDINPGPNGSVSFGAEFQFTCSGNKVYFRAVGPNGLELFEWDGTKVKEHDLRPGPGFSDPNFLTSCANKLFFVARDGTNGAELWVADPVSGSVTMLEISPGPRSGLSVPSFACVEDKVYFSAENATHGWEIFVSDGTKAGTKLAVDIRPGSAWSIPAYLTFCPDAQGGFRLFFRANDASSTPKLQVWDGTKVTVLGPPATRSSGITRCGNKVYYATEGKRFGDEPWVSDGSPAGTFELKDIHPGGESNPTGFTCCGDKVFFRATDGTPMTGTGRELYVTDGTKAGTKLVKDIRPGTASSSPAWIQCVGDEIYFAARDDTAGTELWVSDGTAAGTGLVRDLKRGANGSLPAYLTCCAGDVYFGADGGLRGRELWVLEKPGAMVEEIGQGCGGIHLGASALPKIGGTVQLEGSHAPAAHVGVTFLMVPPSGRPLHVQGVFDECCWGFLTLVAPAHVSTAKTWQSLPTPIPNDPQLRGVSLFYQSYYLPLATALPARTSNGVLLTIGS